MAYLSHLNFTIALPISIDAQRTSILLRNKSKKSITFARIINQKNKKHPIYFVNEQKLNLNILNNLCFTRVKEFSHVYKTWSENH